MDKGILEELDIILYQNNLILTELNLSNVNLQNTSSDLLESLISSKRILKLNLNNCNLTDKQAASIANNLSKNTFLEEISINNNNNIGANGLKTIIKTLTKIDNLKIAKLANINTDLNSKGLELYVGFKNLKILDLSGNKIYNLKNIGSSKSLEDLNLSRCSLFDDNLSLISKSLNGQKNLNLNLSYNHIKGIEIENLCKIIHDGTISVKTLNLSNNDLSNHAALELYRMFINSDGIDEIIIDNNPKIELETVIAINEKNKEKTHKQNHEYIKYITNSNNRSKSLLEPLEEESLTENSTINQQNQRSEEYQTISSPLPPQLYSDFPVYIELIKQQNYENKEKNHITSSPTPSDKNLPTYEEATGKRNQTQVVEQNKTNVANLQSESIDGQSR